jgi:AraC family transcriptional activator of pobA
MKPTPSAIHSFSLFGESKHLPDVLHCETIAERSMLHDWELAPHRHARLHQLLLIRSGSGIAQLDGNTCALSAGSLVNVPPGFVHAFRFTPGTRGWVTTLADELLDEMFVRVGDVRQRLGQLSVIKADAGMTQVVQQIWREYCGRSLARALVLRGLSSTLLGWVARVMAERDQIGVHGPESETVRRLRSLIEEHFLEHWLVADYARALSISPTHLSRLAKNATGHSAQHLIEARLLREARRHLAFTHLSISTIAYALGFTDPAYFSRVFSRDTGLSPKAFRNQLLGPSDGANLSPN